MPRELTTCDVDEWLYDAAISGAGPGGVPSSENRIGLPGLCRWETRRNGHIGVWCWPAANQQWPDCWGRVATQRLGAQMWQLSFYAAFGMLAMQHKTGREPQHGGKTAGKKS